MTVMKKFPHAGLRLSSLVLLSAGLRMPMVAQVHATEYPTPQAASSTAQAAPHTETGTPGAAGTVGAARAIDFDQMAVRKMANGGESRNVAHGTLATGETVNLHESMQVAGTPPNPPHVIEHSEFICIREGEVEFQHEVDGKMVSEKVGPGGVIYVALGTRHMVRNVGNVPAKYFVIAIGGDAK
jgi:mannose-6-phosphate isomerase-like protein (cupin superfamily)